MNLSNERKIIEIFNELKERNLIAPRRKLKALKLIDSFKASVYTSNTIIYNPTLTGLDDNSIKFCLLHEEGHLTRGQYGIPAIFFLIGLGLIPLLCSIYFRADTSIVIFFTFFFLFVFFASFRILTEPFHWDEYGSDEFASTILRDNYQINKPSEILKKALDSLPSSIDRTPLFNRLIIALILAALHPSTEQRVKNIVDVIDKK